MIEIIILVFLSISIHRKATGKGYAGWPFVLLAIVLWFAFEMVGALIGIIVALLLIGKTGDIGDLSCGLLIPTILFAYGAAGFSVWASNKIVARLEPKTDKVTGGVARCPKCGATVFLEDEHCRFCGEALSASMDKERLVYELRRGALSQEERARYVIRLSELGSEILPFLKELFCYEQKIPANAPVLRATLAVAIYKIEGEGFIPEIKRLANDPFPVVRDTALKILAQKGVQGSDFS